MSRPWVTSLKSNSFQTVVPVDKSLLNGDLTLHKRPTGQDILRAHECLKSMNDLELEKELNAINWNASTSNGDYGCLEDTGVSDESHRLSTAKWFLSDHPYWTQKETPNYKGLQSTYMSMCKGKYS